MASVSDQYEHIHTILYKPFLSVSVSILFSSSVNTPYYGAFMLPDTKTHTETKIDTDTNNLA